MLVTWWGSVLFPESKRGAMQDEPRCKCDCTGWKTESGIQGGSTGQRRSRAMDVCANLRSNRCVHIYANRFASVFVKRYRVARDSARGRQAGSSCSLCSAAEIKSRWPDHWKRLRLHLQESVVPRSLTQPSEMLNSHRKVLIKYQRAQITVITIRMLGFYVLSLALLCILEAWLRLDWALNRDALPWFTSWQSDVVSSASPCHLRYDTI